MGVEFECSITPINKDLNLYKLVVKIEESNEEAMTTASKKGIRVARRRLMKQLIHR